MSETGPNLASPCPVLQQLREILQNWQEEAEEYRRQAAAHEASGHWAKREWYLGAAANLQQRIEEIQESIIDNGN